MDTELDRPHGGIIVELGMDMADHEVGLQGRARVVPELWVPGSIVLRTSVLATWADVLMGSMAYERMTPRISITLDLDVQLHRQVAGPCEVTGTARVVKEGRSVVVCDVWFHDGDADDPFAVAHASFMASPKPEHVADPGLARSRRAGLDHPRLTRPFAERARCRMVAPNVAEVPRMLDGQNAAGSIQGGLVALAAEEAARDGAPVPMVASSLSMRYLRSFTVGPARATATVTGPLAHVEVVDTGRDDRLGTVAMVRLEPARG